MNVPNHEKKAFRDMTPEERSAIVEELLIGGVDCLNTKGEWAHSMCDAVFAELIYRTRPRQFVIPWEVIRPEYKWAAMDESGTVYLFGGKPKMFSDGFMADIACNTRALNIDTTGIDWRESLTERPEGV